MHYSGFIFAKRVIKQCLDDLILQKDFILLFMKKVHIFSLSSPVDDEVFNKAILENQSIDFDFSYLLKQNEIKNILPKQEQKKAELLNQAVEDSDVSVLLSLRGGYGCTSCLSYSNLENILKSNKIIVGYSDVSALFAALCSRAIKQNFFELKSKSATSLRLIHGPMFAVEFAKIKEDAVARKSVEALQSLMESSPNQVFEKYKEEIKVDFLRQGNAKGKVFASNLSVLCSLIGTAFTPDLRGVALFLEDVNEPAYKIHRMLMQLSLSGMLDDLSSLIFGDLSPAKSCSRQLEKESEADYKNRISENSKCQEESILESIKDIKDKFLSHTDYPILYNFPFGHKGFNYPLELGVDFEVKNGQLNFSN